MWLNSIKLVVMSLLHAGSCKTLCSRKSVNNRKKGSPAARPQRRGWTRPWEAMPITVPLGVRTPGERDTAQAKQHARTVNSARLTNSARLGSGKAVQVELPGRSMTSPGGTVTSPGGTACPKAAISPGVAAATASRGAVVGSGKAVQAELPGRSMTSPGGTVTSPGGTAYPNAAISPGAAAAAASRGAVVAQAAVMSPTGTAAPASASSTTDTAATTAATAVAAEMPRVDRRTSPPGAVAGSRAPTAAPRVDAQEALRALQAKHRAELDAVQTEWHGRCEELQETVRQLRVQVGELDASLQRAHASGATATEETNWWKKAAFGAQEEVAERKQEVLSLKELLSAQLEKERDGRVEADRWRRATATASRQVLTAREETTAVQAELAHLRQSMGLPPSERSDVAAAAGGSEAAGAEATNSLALSLADRAGPFDNDLWSFFDFQPMAAGTSHTPRAAPW